MPERMAIEDMARKIRAYRESRVVSGADESDTEARFHEGPEGKKEFDAWLKKQPRSVQEEWAENTQKYKDRFKAAADKEEEADAEEDRAEADEEKAEAERSEAEADREDAASKEAGKIKGPGVPDGTGPGKDDPECPHGKDAGDGFSRERLTWGRKEAAVAPGGLYGFTKKDQRDCEAAIRKVQRQAKKIARAAFKRDEQVAAFISTHAKRARSLPAKILVAAFRDLRPKVGASREAASGKDAARGLYGFRAKTATLGLNACSEIRGFAGATAYDLHSRREARYASITGFFKAHGKQARCDYSRILLSSYPDLAMGKVATEEPQTVADWLAWE